MTFVFAGYGIVYYDVFTFSKDSVSSKLFSSISNYLILVDANNTIIEINNNLLNLLNYKHEQVIGKKLKYIIAPDINNANPLNKEMSTSGEFSNEKIVLKTNNDTTVELIFSASPVKVSNSKRAGFVYIGSQEKLDIRQSQSFEEHKRHTRFLAEAALDMFLFQKKEDVYYYITEHIYNLLNKEAIVTFAEFHKESDVVYWEMKSITGIHHRLRNMIKLLGFDPHKMKSTSTSDVHKNIINGRLTSLEFNFEKLTNGLISNKIGEKVKDLFKVKDVSVISL